MKIEISKNEEGLYGAINEVGKVIIPFKFDEITPMDGKYYCRMWKDCIWWDEDGKPGANRKVARFWMKPDPAMMYADEVSNTRPRPFSRDGLDCVPLEEKNGVFIKYANGKFGVLDMEKKEILPCLYDMVYRWRDCEVIETRQGTTYRYFNLQGKEILTEYKYPPVQVLSSPYYVGEEQNDIAVETMEFVDSCYDNQCCMCYGRPTRLDRVLRQDIEPLMREEGERLCFSEDAFDVFNSPYTYIYRAYIVKGKSMADCIEQLKLMGCYQATWNYLDKVRTNKKTVLGMDELNLLSDAVENAETMGLGSGQHEFSYGINGSLKDGEVDIFHLEYFWDRGPDWDEEFRLIMRADRSMGLIWDEIDCNCAHITSEDEVQLFIGKEKPIICTIPDIYSWLEEFKCKSDGVNHNMGSIDVENFHKRGLEFAHRISEVLPDHIDLFYGYPAEDEENKDKKPVRIPTA